jgi:urease accessory protein
MMMARAKWRRFRADGLQHRAIAQVQVPVVGAADRLAGDAACLMVETLVLGRAAMGETVARLGLADRRRVTRDGVPVLIEPVALDDAALARAGGAAMLGGARAWASLAFLAPGAEAAADALRALPEAPGVRWAASGWDGKCVFRALASDARPVRRVLARAVETLAGRLPRVWNM